jgi:hypothetical protein
MANRFSQNGTNGATTTLTKPRPGTGGSEGSHGTSKQGRVYPLLESLVEEAEVIVNQLDFHAPVCSILCNIGTRLIAM